MSSLTRKKKQHHREPRSGVAIQKIVHRIAASASPPRNDCRCSSASADHKSLRDEKRRHREPRSGVAIQILFHWIASSASASSQ